MNRLHAALIALLLLSSNFTIVAMEQQQLLKELSNVPIYKRKAEKTVILAQAQLKYGLNPNSGSGTYGRGRWLDRPLFIDPRPATEPKSPLEFWDFMKMVDNAKQYALDGFSFFPGAGSRINYFDYFTDASDEDFVILTKLTHINYGTVAKKKRVLDRALACTQSFRIGGKVVIETYGASDQNLAEWVNFVEEVRKEYKEKFLFVMKPRLALGQAKEKYFARTLEEKDVEKLKSSILPFLRTFDGLMVAGYVDIMRDGVRIADTNFFQEFFCPLLCSLYQEKEFQHKLLGIQCSAGHANANRIGYSRSHEGTSTLRKTVESAVAARPDFLVVTEWDEQDENTAIRPTVYNSSSYMRIMRFLSNKLNQREQKPLPGDDLTKPNLILSYRKSLTLGEELTIELLNVPDTVKDAVYTCQLFLKDIHGNIVKQFPEKEFNAAELSSVPLKLASESLANQQVLLPAVEIEYEGKQIVCEDGLHYIALNATWNWDYVWVKQPIREIFIPTELKLDSKKSEDGIIAVSADIESDRNLHFAEVLDNDNVVFVAAGDSSPNWRENNEEFTVLLRMDTMKSQEISGSIAVENVPAKIAITRRNKPEVVDNILVFNKWRFSSWSQTVYLTIARQDADEAVVSIDFPQLSQRKIPFKQIIDNHVYCAAGPRGTMFSFHRFAGQEAYPERNNTKKLNFEALLFPHHRNSIIHVRAQNEKGQLYFSKPFLNNTSHDNLRVPLHVYSNSCAKVVRFDIDRSRVFEGRYVIDPQQYGDAFVCDYGRAMWAVGGMSIANVSLRGDQEGACNGLPVLLGHLPADFDKTAPQLTKDDEGEWAWQFDGKDDFVTFPVGFIPRMSAFTLSFKIKPASMDRKQFIIGNRAHYPGSLSEVCVEEGMLKASHVNIDVEFRDLLTDLVIPDNEWSEIKIIYDQENVIFEVNGEQSRELYCPGPGVYDLVSCMGGHQNAWFAGLIKELSIKHYIDKG